MFLQDNMDVMVWVSLMLPFGSTTPNWQNSTSIGLVKWHGPLLSHDLILSIIAVWRDFDDLEGILGAWGLWMPSELEKSILLEEFESPRRGRFWLESWWDDGPFCCKGGDFSTIFFSGFLNTMRYSSYLGSRFPIWLYYFLRWVETTKQCIYYILFTYFHYIYNPLFIIYYIAAWLLNVMNICWQTFIHFGEGIELKWGCLSLRILRCLAHFLGVNV